MKLLFYYTICSFLIFFSLLAKRANAQSQAIDFQSWADGSYNHSLSDGKVLLGGDIGFRGFATQFDWSQFYVRPTFKYIFSQQFDMVGGIAFFKTWNKFDANVGEVRFFERATVEWPSWALLGISHRFQYEQRLLNYDDSNFSFKNAYATRLRYMVSAESKDFTIAQQKIYFKLGLELFHSRFSDINAFVDSDRLIGGVGHRVNNYFKYELHYMLQQSRIDDLNEFETSAHVVRVRLFFRSQKVKNQLI